jgi:hypothetical protein
VACVGNVQAQEVVVNGHFHSDKASIGEVIPYSLTAHYPRTGQVLFPDSTFSFAPFEIRKKIFFPTKTTGGISYDSAVYFLTTFEIDSIQRLQLPVFVLQQKDCVAVVSPRDSIHLQYRVDAMPDSVSTEKLPLKTNTAYQKVQWILNYPLVAIAVLILIVAAVVVWIIFGKRIRKYFAIRRLKRDYEAFMASFAKSLDRLSSEFTSRKAEETLILWKGYMEDLEKYPYTKSTSKEILRLASDQQLRQALQAIDGSIYGGRVTTVEEFRLLQNFSQQRFQKKEEEVMNG